MIKDGMSTSEWKALIGFVVIGLGLIALKRFFPETGIDEAMVQAYWIGGGLSSGLYSLGRGTAKSAPVTVERYMSEMSQAESVSEHDLINEQKKAEALEALRISIIDAEKLGIDTSNYFTKS